MSHATTLALEGGKRRSTGKIALGFISMTAFLLVSTASGVGATSPPSGNGYGGGSNNNVNLNINVEGDNNFVQIILNFIFG